MAFHDIVWRYPIDTELKLVHAFKECPAAKTAFKYKYITERSIKVPADAAELDLLMQAGKLKICPKCWDKEQELARKENRRPRPGFLSMPPGHQPAQRKVYARGARKNVTRD